MQQGALKVSDWGPRVCPSQLERPGLSFPSPLGHFQVLPSWVCNFQALLILCVEARTLAISEEPQVVGNKAPDA